MRFLLLAAIFYCSINTSIANVIINGTRVIYPSNSKDVVVQLVNNSDEPALVQSWIDNGDINSTPETSQAPFLLSPPVVKVTRGGGQQLRITKIKNNLHEDRESIFYLNVLDIPPVPETVQGKNTLQLAIKSRIKLIVRPESLTDGVEKNIKNLSIGSEGDRLRLTNKSPYFISIANIEDTRSRNMLRESVMIAPFSELYVPAINMAKKEEKLKLIFVDDLGAYRKQAFTLH